MELADCIRAWREARGARPRPRRPRRLLDRGEAPRAAHRDPGGAERGLLRRARRPGGPRRRRPVDRRFSLRHPGLPALRDLTLEHVFRVDAKHLDWFFAGRLASRLERFATRQHHDFIESYRVRFEALPLAILEVTDEHEKARYTYTRGSTSRLDQLAIEMKETDRLPFLPTLPGPLEGALLMLEALPDDALRAVSLRWPKKKSPPAPLLERLEILEKARPWSVSW